MIRVGIVGATGYGGRELIRLLLLHADTEFVAATSTSAVGQRVDAVLPAFKTMTNVVFSDFNAQTLKETCDVVFIGVPGKESMAPVAALREAGVRVLDIGADFRLKNLDDFTKYYKADHTAAHLLEESVYGLAPWYRESLKTAQLVAVPGCYPISAVVPLRPLLDAPLSDVPVVIDSISGISGAGKSLSEGLHFPEMNENLKAYKLGMHQHIPEMEQELLHKMTVQFTPHIAPITRGILTTITLRPSETFDPTPYYACYENEPFVRVLGEGVLPDINQVRGTNFCDFGWYRDERTGNLIIVSAIDNLCGGTAGMAMQCLNIMFGLDEKTGLHLGGLLP